LSIEERNRQTRSIFPQPPYHDFLSLGSANKTRNTHQRRDATLSLFSAEDAEFLARLWLTWLWHDVDDLENIDATLGGVVFGALRDCAQRN
jgi:hypothetical protein